jgi:hypothetical protein
MAILCDESIFVQVIEKCLCAIFGFLFSSIHVSMDATCDGNKSQMWDFSICYVRKSWFLLVGHCMWVKTYNEEPNILLWKRTTSFFPKNNF